MLLAVHLEGAGGVGVNLGVPKAPRLDDGLQVLALLPQLLLHGAY